MCKKYEKKILLKMKKFWKCDNNISKERWNNKEEITQKEIVKAWLEKITHNHLHKKVSNIYSYT
jgi:hypothetical protein